jgi:hypothetical protein
MTSEANKSQVGGDHYKGAAIEHWDFVAQRNLDYFQGNITKYVSRWRKKAGVDDLRKASHYLDKYIELARGLYTSTAFVGKLGLPTVREACIAWGTPAEEEEIVALVCEWEGHVNLLTEAKFLLAKLIDKQVEPGAATTAYVGQ